MKKLLLLIGVLTAGNILYAQHAITYEERVVKSKERIRERLDLGAEQELQLKEWQGKYAPDLKAIRRDTEKSRSEKLYAMAAIQAKREQELALILSEKQLEELQLMKKEVRRRKFQRRKRAIKRRKKN